MAHSKRSKSEGSGGKKKSAAKHSLKKKHLSSSKSKNRDMTEILDRQAQALYSVYGVKPPTANPTGTLPSSDASQALVHALTTTLRNL